MPAMDYSPVFPIFREMQQEAIDGLPLSELVGGGDPATVADQLVEVIKSAAGLNATDHVLDIGCGCGRIATALTQHLDHGSRYYGVDIVPGLVEFAQRRITSEYPNFQFFTIDQKNSFYDAFRRKGCIADISALSDICGAQSIDLCIAMSLFTHLSTETARSYLSTIHSVLKPDGRALVTFFVLDATTRALMRGGHPSFRFQHAAQDGTFVENLDAPLHAVAFDLNHLSQLIVDCGLYISAIQYGNWAARRGSPNFQDVLVLRRAPRIVGFLDSTGPTGVRGWAAFRSGSGQPVQISICVDGRTVATLVADNLRPDLVPHGYGTGHHGFAWQPAQSLPATARIETYAAGELIYVA